MYMSSQLPRPQAFHENKPFSESLGTKYSVGAYHSERGKSLVAVLCGEFAADVVGLSAYYCVESSLP